MAAGPILTAFVDELVKRFNERSLDLPDGYFTRHTQLLLNGVAFEEMLGRPASDPLVLMIARGAAGYRFTAKAIQHAVPDATLERGELAERVDGEEQVVNGQCWLSGHLRGLGEPLDLLADVELRFERGTLRRADVAVTPEQIARLQEARARP
jgi:hypothetical protein